MQEKCKKIIEESFQLEVREKKNEFRFNISELNMIDIDHISRCQILCDAIQIKRSGTGLVVIFKF